MRYYAGKLRKIASSYNCSIKAIDPIFKEFIGVINPLGMLEQHSKSL